jgi:undecaprenyl-phosphate galactose phosphotransferase
LKTNEFELTNISLTSNLKVGLQKSDSDKKLVPISVYGLKAIDYKERTLKLLYIVAKRAFDILGSIIGILILIPLTVIIAILNFVCGDKGPVFYSHERIGKYGKKFKMYKFRTMCIDSDKKLEELLKKDEETRKEWEAHRKLSNDPRITKIGKILRKTSIDEFPQFINVLKGEMSLVGPRAVVDDEIELFGESKKLVLSVKPGVTGYWAANGRSSTSYEERVEMESYYAQNCSMILDINILFKTVVSVIKKEGAM